MASDLNTAHQIGRLVDRATQGVDPGSTNNIIVERASKYLSGQSNPLDDIRSAVTGEVHRLSTIGDNLASNNPALVAVGARDLGDSLVDYGSNLLPVPIIKGSQAARMLTMGERTIIGGETFVANIDDLILDGQRVIAAERGGLSALSSAERSALLNSKAEANALRRLQEMQDATPGAHFVERHGSQLTLESQYERAAFGTNPTTGLPGPIPSAATRFFSARDQLNAITRSEQIFANTGSGNLARAPIEFGRPIGEGFNKGLVYGTQNSAQVFLNSSGKAVTAFPRYGY